jgi:hypothetical protein
MRWPSTVLTTVASRGCAPRPPRGCPTAWAHITVRTLVGSVSSAGRRFRSFAPGSRDRRSGADRARSVRPGCGRAHGRQFSGNPAPCDPDPAARAARRQEAWRENDRLQPRPPRLLVDAALAAETEAYLQPSITFLSPPKGVVHEETPLGPVPGNLRSALVAEEETARFEPALWRNGGMRTHDRGG